MNDWDDDKYNQFMTKAGAIGEDLLKESESLSIKFRFTLDPDKRKEIVNRLKIIEQEAIVLKKLSERVFQAHLLYLLTNGEES